MPIVIQPYHTHHLMKLYHIGITVKTIELKIQRSLKIPKKVENLPNVGLISALLVLGNATDTIILNVKNQDVTKLSTKCETGMPTTAWFIKTD